MNILILGASGFLGGHLYKKLVNSKEHKVIGTCFSNKNSNELSECDVRNYDDVKKLLDENKYDAIIWTLVGKPEKLLIEEGLKNVVDLMEKESKIIFMSSNAIYKGDCEYGREDDVIDIRKEDNDLDMYSNSKIIGEGLVKDNCKNYIIVRPGIIYGEDINGNWSEKYSSVFQKVKENIEVPRTKNMYNTFVKVEELAEAIIKLTESTFKGTINLGPEIKKSYYDFYREMSEELGYNKELIKADFRDEDLDKSINTSKSRELLGNFFS